jgi:hypothetical protein
MSNNDSAKTLKNTIITNNKEIVMVAKQMKQNQPDQDKPHLELDGVKHFVCDMNETQVVIFNHLQDLAKKVNNIKFNLFQLQFGQTAFIDAYKASINETKKV